VRYSSCSGNYLEGTVTTAPDSPLAFRERPADGAAEGLLVLHHGRGADQNDLIGLADVLDPERRLHVVTPGGPLRLPGWPGRHWYVVPQVGFPDPVSFAASYRALAAFHDDLWERTGLTPERTILGGFSMGSVMSHALGLGPTHPGPTDPGSTGSPRPTAGHPARPSDRGAADPTSGDGVEPLPARPVVAGILGLSGFVPAVDGWAPDLAPRVGRTRVLNAHGRQDPVIGFGFAEQARALVRAGGLDLTALDFDGGHQIAPQHVPQIAAWVAATLS
jgi:phospholipase/carboxylesterase